MHKFLLANQGLQSTDSGDISCLCKSPLRSLWAHSHTINNKSNLNFSKYYQTPRNVPKITLHVNWEIVIHFTFGSRVMQIICRLSITSMINDWLASANPQNQHNRIRFTHLLFLTLCVSAEMLVTLLTRKSNGSSLNPAFSMNTIRNPPKQASTWKGMLYFSAN